MTYEYIKYDANYFKKHSDHWQNISDRLAVLKQNAENARVGAGALYTSLVIGFKDAHDEVCDTITQDLIANGVTATQTVSDNLIETGRAYIQREAENAAEAQKLESEVFG